MLLGLIQNALGDHDPDFEDAESQEDQTEQKTQQSPGWDRSVSPQRSQR